MNRLAANLGHPWLKLAVQQPSFGSRPKRLGSGPITPVQGLLCTLHSTWLDSWKYWRAHISSVRAPGSALNATFSSLSPNSGAPTIAKDCSSENMYSTTEQSSEPWDGLCPARNSSQEYMPLGSP